MLVGVRVGCHSSWYSSYNHWGETDVLTLNTTTNLYGNPFEFDISATGDAGADDSYGGVASCLALDGSIMYYATSADILAEVGPHGFLLWDSQNTSAPIDPLGAFSYGDIDTGDPKGVGADIEAICQCATCTVNPIIAGNFQCSDNGTPFDASDDFFTVDLTVSGTNVGAYWTSNDGVNSGFYNTPTTFGPFLIDDGVRTITISDVCDYCSAQIIIDPDVACGCVDTKCGTIQVIKN